MKMLLMGFIVFGFANSSVAGVSESSMECLNAENAIVLRTQFKPLYDTQGDVQINPSAEVIDFTVKDVSDDQFQNSSRVRISRKADGTKVVSVKESNKIRVVLTYKVIGKVAQILESETLRSANISLPVTLQCAGL